MHRRLPAFAALALAHVPLAPLTAQTFPAENASLRRIWTIGMDSSLTEPLAQVLLDSVGPRLSGTAGQKSGNDWLVRTY